MFGSDITKWVGWTDEAALLILVCRAASKAPREPRAGWAVVKLSLDPLRLIFLQVSLLTSMISCDSII
jgi:hypothetical protein